MSSSSCFIKQAQATVTISLEHLLPSSIFKLWGSSHKFHGLGAVFHAFFLLLCGRLFVLHFLWKFLWTWPLVSIWPFVVVVIVVGGKHNVVIPRTLPAFFHNFFYLSFCTQTWQRCISTQFHKWQALAFQNFLCINRGKQASCQAYNIHILAHICIVHTYQRLFGFY